MRVFMGFLAGGGDPNRTQDHDRRGALSAASPQSLHPSRSAAHSLRTTATQDSLASNFPQRELRAPRGAHAAVLSRTATQVRSEPAAGPVPIRSSAATTPPANAPSWAAALADPRP